MSDVAEPLTIVVGYDGSDAAWRGLERVGGGGERVARVLVVAVAPDVRSMGLGSPLAGDSFDTQRLLEEASKLLGSAEWLTVELRAAAGDPAVVLVECAREEQAGRLVVGRRGGDFVARTLLGSVAQRAVQQPPLRRAGGRVTCSAPHVEIPRAPGGEVSVRPSSGRATVAGT